MIHVVLIEPEIPGNTGNISRTCAVTGAALHLVEPLGFSIDEKHVKRAGLDYWSSLELYRYRNTEEFFEKNQGGAFYFFSSKAGRLYTEVEYPKECYLIFGKETKGLPEEMIFDNYDRAVRLPMKKDARCLNLSNAAAIAVYEALRQQGFAGLI